MKCSQCGFEQEEGKFCGKCGGKLISAAEAEPTNDHVTQAENPNNASVEQETSDQTSTQTERETAASVANQAAETNESLEKVKETSRAYGGFFINYLKNPSQIFARQSSELTNGLITIGIVALLTILTFYSLINNAMGEYGYGPSFISVFFNTLIGLVVFIAIVVTLLFLINKLFGTDISYQSVVSIFGAHMTPVAIFVAIAFLLSILKSNMYAILFLMIGLALIISIIPLYIISSLLTKRPKGIDPLYGYLLYILAFIISFSILAGILVDSALGNMIEMIDDMMYYMY